MIERQELHCHNCNRYVQFNLDLELNGEHILTCPNCGHKHYRYIKDGKISDRRWGQDPSQQQSMNVTGYITTSATSTYTTYTGTSSYLYISWMSSTTASAA